MDETLSPYKSPLQKQPTLPKSPSSTFFLGSNDDKLERAQARAARAAAIRRKPLAAAHTQPTGEPSPLLGKGQILELFQNCIKLASENKINQKNTWELGLIDHLYELVKAEEEDDTETNFQKASCTLEAGVKIYSLRVDSVHSEAYKVLSGINRVGQEDEQGPVVEDRNVGNGQEEGYSKKGLDKKISPLSTLESSFEALNVKKFDVAFVVDPLYHQTSAQFDEGGAKGLLLNNLGVYDECLVLFDSMEVPGKCTSENHCDNSDTIDLSFLREYIQKIALPMQMKNEIMPTLSIIVNQFDEDNRRSIDSFSASHKPAEQEDLSYNNEDEFNDFGNENSGTWSFDHDELASVGDDDSAGALPNFSSYNEENEQFSVHDTYMDDGLENVENYLFSSLGFTSKNNSWAGPDHWKYRKAKGSEAVPATENGSPVTTKGRKTRKKSDIDIDFTKALGNEMPDIFAPPKNSKTLLLPATRSPCNTRLPEDCHYQPENMVKLFLLPNTMCLGRRRRKSPVSDESRQQDNYGHSSSWDDDNAFDGQFDEASVHSDVEDSNTLVSQPRQVNKIEVEYDKNSKQVDVQALKTTLWDHIRDPPQKSCQVQETVSFRNVLANFPSDCRAATTIEEISPHLCFICLLHLANEHSLSIQGSINLDDLSIAFHSDTLSNEVL